MHGKDEILSKMWTRFIQIVDLKFRICYIVDGSPSKVVDLAPAKVTTFSLPLPDTQSPQTVHFMLSFRL